MNDGGGDLLLEDLEGDECVDLHEAGYWLYLAALSQMFISPILRSVFTSISTIQALHGSSDIAIPYLEDKAPWGE